MATNYDEMIERQFDRYCELLATRCLSIEGLSVGRPFGERWYVYRTNADSSVSLNAPGFPGAGSGFASPAELWEGLSIAVNLLCDLPKEAN